MKKKVFGYVLAWLITIVMAAIHNGFASTPFMSLEEFAAAMYFSAIALALHGFGEWAWKEWA